MNLNKIVRRTIVALSIPLFVFSIYRVYEYRSLIKAEQEYQNKIESLGPKLIVDNHDNNTDSSYVETTVESEPDPKESDTGSVKSWAYDLIARNREAVGWIRIPGFVDSSGNEYINYPVLQHSDNSYYLDHNIDHQYYYSGSIYADYEDPITETAKPDNIVIYGHHMRNLGTAFTHLAEYKSGISFLRAHPIILFNTIYESEPEEYVIISCYVAAENESQDKELFDYWRYHYFSSGSMFDYWLKKTLDSSWYSCDVKCDKDDEYITLSTCSNEVADMRWVITAKKLDEDDDKDKIIGSMKAKEDKDIYFPEVWKNVWGNHIKYLGWNY